MSGRGGRSSAELDAIRRWVLLHAVLLAAACLGAFVAEGSTSDDTISLSCFAIVLASALCCVSWWSVQGTLFDLHGCVLVASILFGGGHAFLVVLDALPEGPLAEFSSSATVVRTLLLILVGLTALHAGALAGVLAVESRRTPARPPAAAASAARARALRRVGLVLLAISAVPAALDLRRTASIVASGGYFALYQQDVSTGIDAAGTVLAAFLVPSAIFLCAGAEGRRIWLALSATVVLVYSTTHFFAGGRGGAALALISYTWLWHRTVRPLPTLALVVTGSFFVFVVFPVIASVRTTSDASAIRALGDTLSELDRPAKAVLREMGNTAGVLAHTIELVPAERSHDLGASYFYASLSVFPNLFWDIHPTIAYGRPSEWLVWRVEPGLAARGGALDYSAVAEAYLNFGAIGVPVVLGALGCAVGAFTRWARSGRHRLAVAACVMAFLPWYARSELARLARPFAWQAALPYAAAVILARGDRRPSPSSRRTAPRW